MLAEHLHTPDDLLLPPFEHLHHAPAAALPVCAAVVSSRTRTRSPCITPCMARRGR